jgi:glycerate kinase
MRIVIAPQEFKGSLTAVEAARAIAAGVRKAMSDCEMVEAPTSDGGPGLVDAMLAGVGGERIESDVHDPLMRPVKATWAILASGDAVIEMAAASGLVLLSAEERAPLVATTYGTGELILAALDRGCAQIIVGVGGSATIDGGAGAMQALGLRLLDAVGDDITPGGGSLVTLDRIDVARVDPRRAHATIRVASDVTNTLCGPAGAAVMFGAQKGASPGAVRALDAGLRHFAGIVIRDCGRDVLELSGGGAAGGLAAGLAALGASIEPGFAIVADATGLEAKIAAADTVITGEGRLDAQTAYGKTASGVAALARKHGKRIAVIAGSVDASYDAAAGLFDLVESVIQPGMSVEDAMRDAGPLLTAAAARVVGRL